ncbi:MAG: hypothetical protein A2Y90_03390 [Chloroflexi bacterium RBG_13_52_12]|nr:MAG: hypothetical protein A2Y90_03390 [Chloroflexi bacterium RBG_13_52_12]
MRGVLLQSVLFGCLLCLLAALIIGCSSNSAQLSEASPGDESLLVSSGNSEEPVGGPFTPWNWEAEFNTTAGCNTRTVEIPHCPAGMLVQASFVTEGNFIWGNVAKCWIFVNGKQVAYDVGRDVALNWKGWLNTGDKIEFKACAQTHGDDKDVKATVDSVRR